MNDVKFDVSKGHRDWYGRDAVLRNEVRDKLRTIFERYGFEPIETPIIEDREAIAFKGGGEIQKEVYRLSDQGGRSLALRFDQTVPLARFVATHRDVKMPFKRYVIGPVFRDGPTQPEQGRFRSFTQCDVDMLGVKEMTAEAELMALANSAFSTLGLGEVEFYVNNRKLLEGMLDASDIIPAARARTISTLDKMDKIGVEGVRDGLLNLTYSDTPRVISNDLLRRLQQSTGDSDFDSQFYSLRGEIAEEVGTFGLKDLREKISTLPTKDKLDFIREYQTFGEKILSPANVSRLMDIVSVEGTNAEKLASLKNIIKSDQGLEGLSEISRLLSYADAQGLGFVQLSPSLARGLNYYTGTTLEVYLKNREIVNSAILAGGRFDNMVGDFRQDNQQIPAVGFSFGLERLVMILRENKEGRQTPTDLYLIPLGTTEACLKIAEDLRKQGLNVAMELREGIKPQKSTSYAIEKGIPFIGYLGETELSGAVPKLAVKDTATRKQLTVEVPAVHDYIKFVRMG